MESGYVKWDSKYNSSEWFSGLVLFSLHVYFFKGAEKLSSNNSIFDLFGAETVLTESLKHLPSNEKNIRVKAKGESLVKEDIDEPDTVKIGVELYELVQMQIASLHYYHNYTFKERELKVSGFYRPKFLRKILQENLLKYPTNSCFWEIFVKSESSARMYNRIDSLSHQILSK
ncbi:hypothetical protein AYI69_g7425 [Smittium culicis]|uniref:Uncharacterized protein n=1 Tax=Smittium culicis TaxID=133412 RepID=A0A1R1XS19_9FUNG|nr:hypothetical protein AYI69_g7425 [Smittium culicis]